MKQSKKNLTTANVVVPSSESGLVSNRPPAANALGVKPGAAKPGSEAEVSYLPASEAVIGTALHAFVDVGLAFACIRDRRLYRIEFATFDAYCRAKWKHGRAKVDRLIAAAQLFMQLQAANPALKPDRQTQLRPLVGLTPEQAQSAWENAAAKAGAGRITGFHVKSAVAEMGLGRRRKPSAKRR